MEQQRQWGPYIPSSVLGTQCVPVGVKAFGNSVFCHHLGEDSEVGQFKGNVSSLGLVEFALNSAKFVLCVYLWLRFVSVFDSKF